MASGILSILDDMAALMDDVAVASKLATRKTAGILGDDLAVNAEKATGFAAQRELPVLWAITKGSFINKLIIIPLALLLNAFSPFIIKIILIAGGFYLAYEGAEKIVEYIFHKKANKDAIESVSEAPIESEKEKIRSAITTDFILSIEIVIIALGTVLEEPLAVKIITVFVVSLLATVGVYGIVAIIVRMDDVGYKLIKRSGAKGIRSKFGYLLIRSLPLIIRFFSFIGTIALLLVSGGIFVHNIDYLHHHLVQLPLILKEFFSGLAGGLVIVAVVSGIKKVFFKKKA